jgi:hypothetical protein
MRWICRGFSDLNMMWSKMSFFLIDKFREDALVLVTETKEVDPGEKWSGQLVIGAYELGRESHAYLVPIISPLHDDSLPKEMP